MVEDKPLTGSYRGYAILTAPPPSSGGVGILQMLGVLEGSGYEKSGAGSAASLHFLAETMRRYFADRSEYLGDPEFVKVPVSELLDPPLHRRSAPLASIRRTPRPATQVRPGKLERYESTETTHYTIVDAEGNVVAVTYTLNGGYGSGVTAPGLGFPAEQRDGRFRRQAGHSRTRTAWSRARPMPSARARIRSRR